MCSMLCEFWPLVGDYDTYKRGLGGRPAPFEFSNQAEFEQIPFIAKWVQAGCKLFASELLHHYLLVFAETSDAYDYEFIGTIFKKSDWATAVDAYPILEDAVIAKVVMSGQHGPDLDLYTLFSEA